MWWCWLCECSRRQRRGDECFSNAHGDEDVAMQASRMRPYMKKQQCCGFVNAHKDEDAAMPLLALWKLVETKMWWCGGATAGFALWYEHFCVDSVKKITFIFFYGPNIPGSTRNYNASLSQNKCFEDPMWWHLLNRLRFQLIGIRFIKRSQSDF